MTGPLVLDLVERTRADRRTYLEDGLTPLACEVCGAGVRVRKNSPIQTSVQWTVDAARRCVEFGESSPPVTPRVTCTALRDSIEGAVREGRLDVAGSRPND